MTEQQEVFKDPGSPAEPANEEERVSGAGDWPRGREGAQADEVSPETVRATAEEFIEGLLEAMGLEASITTEISGDRTLIDITGEDLGILIGRRGQTLEAVQELVRTAVQRRLRARVPLLVDVEGYRGRRRASLAEYARAMARRAQERGTEIELESMNAYERKIVHDAVAEIEGATSFSEGEEPDRKVVVRGE